MFCFTSLVLDYSRVVICTDKLLEAEFDPAALAVLQLALLASYVQVLHLVGGDAAASLLADVFKGTQVKAKAFNAIPRKKIRSKSISGSL